MPDKLPDRLNVYDQSGRKVGEVRRTEDSYINSAADTVAGGVIWVVIVAVGAMIAAAFAAIVFLVSIGVRKPLFGLVMLAILGIAVTAGAVEAVDRGRATAAAKALQAPPVAAAETVLSRLAWSTGRLEGAWAVDQRSNYSPHSPQTLTGGYSARGASLLLERGPHTSDAPVIIAPAPQNQNYSMNVTLAQLDGSVRVCNSLPGTSGSCWTVCPVTCGYSNEAPCPVDLYNGASTQCYDFPKGVSWSPGPHTVQFAFVNNEIRVCLDGRFIAAGDNAGGRPENPILGFRGPRSDKPLRAVITSVLLVALPDDGRVSGCGRPS